MERPRPLNIAPTILARIVKGVPSHREDMRKRLPQMGAKKPADETDEETP